MAALVMTAALIVAGVDGSPWEHSLETAELQRAVRVATTVQVGDPPPVVAAITPLCHGDWPNALEVSAAIEAFLPAKYWYRMCGVAWCESRFRPYASNGSHVGVWQIDRNLWGRLGYDLRDIDQSTKAAAEILKAQGIYAWSCA